MEKNLVEFALAGHLAQGTNLDAGRFHIHEENRETFVFGNRRVRSNDEFAPVSHPAATGPHFLTVDDVMSIRKARFGLQGGQIRSRVGFGETLAPDFFRAENLWDEPLLLCVRAISDDRWAYQA